MADFYSQMLGMGQASPLMPQPAAPGAVAPPPAGGQVAPQGMASIVQPQLAEQPGPPVSVEDFVARKAGWLDQLTQFAASPEGSAALLQLGAGLLQGVQPGQTTGGAIGNAMLKGAGAYAGVKDAKRAKGIEDKKLGMETERFAMQKEEFATNQEEKKTLTPLKRQKIEAELAKLAQEGLAESVKYKGLEKRLQLADAKTEAETRNLNSQASLRDRTDPNAQGGAGGAAGSAKIQLAKHFEQTELQRRALAQGVEVEKLSEKDKLEARQVGEEALKTSAQMDSVAGNLRAAQVLASMGMEEQAQALVGQATGEIASRGAKGKSAEPTTGKPRTTAEVRAGKPAEVKVASEADIAATMKATGLDRKTVLEKIKAKGYTIAGETK